MLGYGSNPVTTTEPNVVPSDQNTILDEIPDPNAEREPVADWLVGPVEGPDEENWASPIQKAEPIVEPLVEPPAYMAASIEGEAPISDPTGGNSASMDSLAGGEKASTKGLVAEPLKEDPVPMDMLVEGGEGSSGFPTPETPHLGDDLVKDLWAGGGTRRMDSFAPDNVLPSRRAKNGPTGEEDMAPPMGLKKGVVRAAQGIAIGAAVLSLLIGGRQLYKWFTTRRDGKAKKPNARSVKLENDETTRNRW
jgi:hypothetical protein